MSNTESNKVPVAFSAIRPYLERRIVSSEETVTSSGERVTWGDGNAYPDYLLDLFDTVTDLAAIINGSVDYVSGDEVIYDGPTFARGAVNRQGDSPRDIVRALAMDLFLYGGFAVQVVRNINGDPVELYHIDLRYLRSNKDNTVFYYSEKWGKTGKKNVLTYPEFMPVLNWAELDEEQRGKATSSILFYKGGSRRVYPVPPYEAAIVACEAERSIDEFHLHSVENGFVASAIVNFHNGIPDDETKDEIERTFTEKFSGSRNGGRILFSWNPNKESATTIEYPKVEDFGERYEALAKTSRQRIFTAFRANPNLFGIPTDSLGFSSEEYESAFKLFNRTTIQPAQQAIVDAFEKIFGRTVLTIQPFTLDGAGEGAVR